jgi:predicted RNase H-like HicB family nuclease
MNSRDVIKMLHDDGWYLVLFKELTMKFPVVLHTDDGLNFGVIVPDVAGCFSAGEGIDDALESTQEALALHFESLVADGDPLPKPSFVDEPQRQS